MRITFPLACSAVFGLSLFACGDDGGGGDPDANVSRPDARASADADLRPDARVDVAPGPVTDFSASPATPNSISLAWTNPSDADLDGILLVVGNNISIDFEPTDGTAVQVGDAVGTDQSAIFAGNASDFAFADVIPGLNYNFAAWAYDTDLNYSPIALTSGVNNAIGYQSATLSVDLATQVVTVTSANHLAITATAVYDDATDTLNIETTVQNDTGRILFNLKGLSTAINQGAQAGNTFPIVGGQPSTYYGPESLVVGAQAIRTIGLTGIDGLVDPITVDLSFVDAPMIYGGNYGGDYLGVDSSGSTEGFNVGLPGDVGQQVRQIAMTPDARFIYGVGKNEPGIVIIDTTTNLAVAGADLSTAGIGSGGGIAVSKDGTVYVGYNDKAHLHGGDAASGGAGTALADLHLIKFDNALAEQARITFATAEATGRTVKTLFLSPDETKLAVVVSSRTVAANELWLIDLETFAVIDADAITAGEQPVALAITGFAEEAAWSEDGSTVFVGSNGRDDGLAPNIAVVNTADFSVTELTPVAPGVAVARMAARNGKLYVPLRNGTGSLTIFDIAGGTQVEADINANIEMTGVLAAPDGIHYYGINRRNVMTYTAADDLRVDTDGDAGNGITDITSTEEIRAHMMLITPF